MKSLVAEKCKPCEIYRSMCGMYEGVCFIEKKMLTNEWAKHEKSWKDSPWSRNTWTFSKKKSSGSVVTKEGDANSHLGHDQSLLISLKKKLI